MRPRIKGRRLEWRFRLHWLWSELGAILVVLALGGLFAGGVGWFYTRESSKPATEELATVVHFGHRDSKYEVHPLVVVRLKNGDERQLMAGNRNRLVHCRKGSTIRLIRRGSALFVDPRGCGQVRVNELGAPMASTGARNAAIA